MVMGSQSVGFYGSRAKDYKEAYVLTCNPNYKPKNKYTKVCNDIDQLITRFQHSEQELLVIGGLAVWKAFLPYADRMLIAETYRDVPGDLVFSEWDNGEFELVKEEKGKKLSLLEYRRKAQQ